MLAVGVKYDRPGPENVGEVGADPSRTEFLQDPPLRVGPGTNQKQGGVPSPVFPSSLPCGLRPGDWAGAL